MPRISEPLPHDSAYCFCGGLVFAPRQVGPRDKAWFALDLPVEGHGFEPSVPQQIRSDLGTAGRCRRDLCWNLIGAVSGWMRIRGQAARSIG